MLLDQGDRTVLRQRPHPAAFQRLVDLGPGERCVRPDEPESNYGMAAGTLLSRLPLRDAQVHRITKIIRDLVDFSRPSNYMVVPTDLVKTLSAAVEIVKMGKKAKDITFLTRVRMQIPLLPLVPDQISQVFINILLNAVDALQGKRGTIVSEVEQDDDHIKVTITDNGHGIAEENLPKIFEPFFTTKRVGEGTGLGLWVSYGIVRSFGGDITVSSEWAKGTTFTLVFPLSTEQFQRRPT